MIRWCLAVGGSAFAIAACSGQIDGIGPADGNDAGVDAPVAVEAGKKPLPPDPPGPPPAIDSGSETGTIDAAKDSSTTTKDASAVDSGSWDDDAGSCKKTNVTFIPPTIHPPAPIQSACTDSQIAALADACSKEPESVGCKTAREMAANKSCSECLFGSINDANWKMLSVDPGNIPPARYNQAGCIDLKSGVKDCGKGYFTVASCFESYCGDCVGADETYCQKDTAQGSGECKPYLIDQACGNALDAVEKTCFPAENTDAAIKTLFVNMATLWCRGSGGALDGG